MPSRGQGRVDVRDADIGELVVLDEEDEAVDAVLALEGGGARDPVIPSRPVADARPGMRARSSQSIRIAAS